LQLDLFRIRVFLPNQDDFFRRNLSRGQLIREAVGSKPTAPVWYGVHWHIGNVEVIDETGVYCALGRTTRGRIPVIDQRSGDFVEQEFDSAPYTHVLLDLELEVCAIARKTSLAPTTSAIARHLGRVLMSSPTVGASGVSFDVSEISDPEQFLAELKRAYAISFFKVTLKRPNPFDINADFLGPLSKAIEEADGETGEAAIKGKALDPVPLEELTRSAASTGDNAAARMYLQNQRRSVYRSLRGDTASISADALDDQDDRHAALDAVRARYKGIRKPKE